MTKVCNKCKADKFLEEFYADKHQADGYKTFCKMCDNAQSRAWYEKSKGKLSEKQKAARRDAYKRWKDKN